MENKANVFPSRLRLDHRQKCPGHVQSRKCLLSFRGGGHKESHPGRNRMLIGKSSVAPILQSTVFNPAFRHENLNLEESQYQEAISVVEVLSTHFVITGKIFNSWVFT